MHLSDATPGSYVVDGELDRWRIIAHGVKLDGDRRLSAEDLADLSVGVALGKGGASPLVSVRGRRWGINGTLAISAGWGSAGSTSHLVLFTTGHGLIPEAEFVRRWRSSQRRNVARFADDPWIAVSHPAPASERRSVVGYGSLSHQLLVDGHLWLVDDTPEGYAPLGALSDHDVVVRAESGHLYRVDPICLVRDAGPHSFELTHCRDRAAEEATLELRRGVKSALVNLANQAGVDPARISVDPDRLTIPLGLLEAIVMGDTYGVGAVVDGLAILRDEVAALRVSP